MRYFLDQSIEAKWKVRCFIWPIKLNHVGVRWRSLMKVINEEVCGSAILEKKMKFWKFKILWLHEEGKENREKEKEKKLKLKGYFL